MPSCRALGCRNNTAYPQLDDNGKLIKVTYHSFPLRNPTLLAKWLKNLNNGTWQPTVHSKLCSDHFEERCFNRFTNTRLLTEAVPTIFPEPTKKRCRRRTTSLPAVQNETSILDTSKQPLVVTPDIPSSNATVTSNIVTVPKNVVDSTLPGINKDANYTVTEKSLSIVDHVTVIYPFSPLVLDATTSRSTTLVVGNPDRTFSVSGVKQSDQVAQPALAKTIEKSSVVSKVPAKLPDVPAQVQCTKQTVSSLPVAPSATKEEKVRRSIIFKLENKKLVKRDNNVVPPSLAVPQHSPVPTTSVVFSKTLQSATLTTPPPITLTPIVKSYEKKPLVIPTFETSPEPLLYHGPGIKNREMPSCPEINLPPKIYKPRKILKKNTSSVPKDNLGVVNVKVIAAEEAKKMSTTDKNIKRVTSPNIPNTSSYSPTPSNSSDDEKIILHVDKHEKAIIDKLSSICALKLKDKKTQVLSNTASSSKLEKPQKSKVLHIYQKSGASKSKSKNCVSVPKTLLSSDGTIPLIPKDVKVSKSDANLITKHLRVCLEKIQGESPVLLSEIPGFIKQEIIQESTADLKNDILKNLKKLQSTGQDIKPTATQLNPSRQNTQQVSSIVNSEKNTKLKSTATQSSVENSTKINSPEIITTTIEERVKINKLKSAIKQNIMSVPVKISKPKPAENKSVKSSIATQSSEPSKTYMPKSTTTRIQDSIKSPVKSGIPKNIPVAVKASEPKPRINQSNVEPVTSSTPDVVKTCNLKTTSSTKNMVKISKSKLASPRIPRMIGTRSFQSQQLRPRKIFQQRVVPEASRQESSQKNAKEIIQTLIERNLSSPSKEKTESIIPVQHYTRSKSDAELLQLRSRKIVQNAKKSKIEGVYPQNRNIHSWKLRNSSIKNSNLKKIQKKKRCVKNRATCSDQISSPEVNPNITEEVDTKYFVFPCGLQVFTGPKLIDASKTDIISSSEIKISHVESLNGVTRRSVQLGFFPEPENLQSTEYGSTEFDEQLTSDIKLEDFSELICDVNMVEEDFLKNVLVAEIPENNLNQGSDFLIPISLHDIVKVEDNLANTNNFQRVKKIVTFNPEVDSRTYVSPRAPKLKQLIKNILANLASNKPLRSCLKGATKNNTDDEISTKIKTESENLKLEVADSFDMINEEYCVSTLEIKEESITDTETSIDPTSLTNSDSLSSKIVQNATENIEEISTIQTTTMMEDKEKVSTILNDTLAESNEVSTTQNDTLMENNEEEVSTTQDETLIKENKEDILTEATSKTKETQNKVIEKSSKGSFKILKSLTPVINTNNTSVPQNKNNLEFCSTSKLNPKPQTVVIKSQDNLFKINAESISTASIVTSESSYTILQIVPTSVEELPKLVPLKKVVPQIVNPDVISSQVKNVSDSKKSYVIFPNSKVQENAEKISADSSISCDNPAPILSADPKIVETETNNVELNTVPSKAMQQNCNKDKKSSTPEVPRADTVKDATESTEDEMTTQITYFETLVSVPSKSCKSKDANNSGKTTLEHYIISKPPHTPITPLSMTSFNDKNLQIQNQSKNSPAFQNTNKNVPPPPSPNTSNSEQDLPYQTGRTQIYFPINPKNFDSIIAITDNDNTSDNEIAAIKRRTECSLLEKTLEGIGIMSDAINPDTSTKGDKNRRDAYIKIDRKPELTPVVPAILPEVQTEVEVSSETLPSVNSLLMRKVGRYKYKKKTTKRKYLISKGRFVFKETFNKQVNPVSGNIKTMKKQEKKGTSDSQENLIDVGNLSTIEEQSKEAISDSQEANCLDSEARTTSSQSTRLRKSSKSKKKKPETELQIRKSFRVNKGRQRWQKDIERKLALHAETTQELDERTLFFNYLQLRHKSLLPPKTTSQTSQRRQVGQSATRGAVSRPSKTTSADITGTPAVPSVIKVCTKKVDKKIAATTCPPGAICYCEVASAVQNEARKMLARKAYSRLYSPKTTEETAVNPNTTEGTAVNPKTTEETAVNPKTTGGTAVKSFSLIQVKMCYKSGDKLAKTRHSPGVVDKSYMTRSAKTSSSVADTSYSPRSTKISIMQNLRKVTDSKYKTSEVSKFPEKYSTSKTSENETSSSTSQGPIGKTDSPKSCSAANVSVNKTDEVAKQSLSKTISPIRELRLEIEKLSEYDLFQNSSKGKLPEKTGLCSKTAPSSVTTKQSPTKEKSPEKTSSCNETVPTLTKEKSPETTTSYSKTVPSPTKLSPAIEKSSEKTISCSETVPSLPIEKTPEMTISCNKIVPSPTKLSPLIEKLAEKTILCSKNESNLTKSPENASLYTETVPSPPKENLPEKTISCTKIAPTPTKEKSPENTSLRTKIVPTPTKEKSPENTSLRTKIVPTPTKEKSPEKTSLCTKIVPTPTKEKSPENTSLCTKIVPTPTKEKSPEKTTLCSTTLTQQTPSKSDDSNQYIPEVPTASEVTPSPSEEISVMPILKSSDKTWIEKPKVADKPTKTDSQSNEASSRSLAISSTTASSSTASSSCKETDLPEPANKNYETSNPGTSTENSRSDSNLQNPADACVTSSTDSEVFFDPPPRTSVRIQTKLKSRIAMRLANAKTLAAAEAKAKLVKDMQTKLAEDERVRQIIEQEKREKNAARTVNKMQQSAERKVRRDTRIVDGVAAKKKKAAEKEARIQTEAMALCAAFYATPPPPPSNFITIPDSDDSETDSIIISSSEDELNEIETNWENIGPLAPQSPVPLQLPISNLTNNTTTPSSTISSSKEHCSNETLKQNKTNWKQIGPKISTTSLAQKTTVFVKLFSSNLINNSNTTTPSSTITSSEEYNLNYAPNQIKSNCKTIRPKNSLVPILNDKSLLPIKSIITNNTITSSSTITNLTIKNSTIASSTISDSTIPNSTIPSSEASRSNETTNRTFLTLPTPAVRLAKRPVNLLESNSSDKKNTSLPSKIIKIMRKSTDKSIIINVGSLPIRVNTGPKHPATQPVKKQPTSMQPLSSNIKLVELEPPASKKPRLGEESVIFATLTPVNVVDVLEPTQWTDEISSQQQQQLSLPELQVKSVLKKVSDTQFEKITMEIPLEKRKGEFITNGDELSAMQYCELLEMLLVLQAKKKGQRFELHRSSGNIVFRYKEEGGTWVNLFIKVIYYKSKNEASFKLSDHIHSSLLEHSKSLTKFSPDEKVVHLVYTNAGLHLPDDVYGVPVLPSSFNDINDLENLFKNPLKVIKDEAIKLNLAKYTDLDAVNIVKFFEEFVIALSQPEPNELKEIVKDLIRNVFDCPTFECRKFFAAMKRFAVSGGEINNVSFDKFFKSLEQQINEEIITVPRKSVANFFDRKNELEVLLNHTKSPKQKTIDVAITGIPGVGKSELVLQFIQQNPTKFDHILWIKSDNESSLELEFLKIAEKLNLLEKTPNEYMKCENKNLNLIVSKIYKLLNSFKCLIVFDNATKKSDIWNYLPSQELQSNNIFYIVTSKIVEWECSLHIPLNCVHPSASHEFLRQNISDNTDKEIEELATILGHHPLALQLVILYMKRQIKIMKFKGEHYKISDFIESYKKSQDFFLDFKVSKDELPYNKLLINIWDTDLATLSDTEHGELAINILKLMSHIEPYNIPCKLFENLFEISTGNPDDYYDALLLLENKSMIKCENKNVYIHCLLQDIIRKKCRNEVSILINLLTLLSQNINSDGKYENVDLVPHAIKAWSFTTQHENISQEFKKIPIAIMNSEISNEKLEPFIVNQLLSFPNLFGYDNEKLLELQIKYIEKLFNEQKYNVTLQICNNSLTKLPENLKNHILAIKILFYKAQCLCKLDLCDEAWETFENVYIAQNENVSSNDDITLNDWSTLIAMCNMACKFNNQEALEVCMLLITQRSTDTRADYNLTMSYIRFIAQIFINENKSGLAIQLYDKILEGQIREFGEDDDHTIRTLFDKSVLLYNQLQLCESYNILVKLKFKNIIEPNLIENIIELMFDVVYKLYNLKNKYNELEMFINLIKKKAAETHVILDVVLLNIFKKCFESLDLITVYDEAYKSVCSELGNKHMITMYTLICKGQSLKRSYRLVEAHAIFNSVFVQYKLDVKVFNKALTLMCETACELDAIGKSEPLNESCIAIQDKIVAHYTNQKIFLDAINIITNYLLFSNKSDKALKLFDDVHSVLRLKFGESDLHTLCLVTEKAKFLCKIDKLDEAWEILCKFCKVLVEKPEDNEAMCKLIYTITKRLENLKKKGSV